MFCFSEKLELNSLWDLSECFHFKKTKHIRFNFSFLIITISNQLFLEVFDRLWFVFSFQKQFCTFTQLKAGTHAVLVYLFVCRNSAMNEWKHLDQVCSSLAWWVWNCHSGVPQCINGMDTNAEHGRRLHWALNQGRAFIRADNKNAKTKQSEYERVN